MPASNYFSFDEPQGCRQCHDFFLLCGTSSIFQNLLCSASRIGHPVVGFIKYTGCMVQTIKSGGKVKWWQPCMLTTEQPMWRRYEGFNFSTNSKCKGQSRPLKSQMAQTLTHHICLTTDSWNSRTPKDPNNGHQSFLAVLVPCSCLFLAVEEQSFLKGANMKKET